MYDLNVYDTKKKIGQFLYSNFFSSILQTAQQLPLPSNIWQFTDNIQRDIVSNVNLNFFIGGLDVKINKLNITNDILCIFLFYI